MKTDSPDISVPSTERKLAATIFSTAEGRAWLEREVLPRWIPSRRWFGGKARTITRLHIAGTIPVGVDALQLLAVGVAYSEGPSDLYAVPLGISAQDEVEDLGKAALLVDAHGAVLHDAVFHPIFRTALFNLVRNGASISTTECRLEASSGAALHDAGDPGSSRVLGVEQSNTAIVWGDRFFLKLFRRLQAGVNPDAEIVRYLTERGFAHVPPFGGELRWALQGGQAMPFGLIQGCVRNTGDAWHWALGELRSYFAAEDAAAAESSLARIRLLGERTAKMHVALAATGTTADFAPEAMTTADFAALSQDVVTRFDRVMTALASSKHPLAAEAMTHAPTLRARVAELAHFPPCGLKTRHHGDYHLGQVLDVGTDWVIIDFEGEPLRPLTERRAKRSPLRDVAGMIRSLHYAPHAARPDAERATFTRAERWASQARSAFLQGYLSEAQGQPFLPADSADFDALLAAFTLEKALYEVDYELNNRPDWLPIPLQGVLSLVGR